MTLLFGMLIVADKAKSPSVRVSGLRAGVGFAILSPAAGVAASIQQRKAKKMKKTIMAVAGLAMAFVLAGCGGSPSSVAKKFANAVIQRDTEAALKRYYTSAMTDEEIKSLRENKIEKMGKDINDDKLEASVYSERILVAGEKDEYQIVNGKKITNDESNVVIQFVRGKDKKSEGLKIDLLKVDGAWLVRDFKSTSDLDTSDK